ncbi:hypothetical protein AB1Y20_019348 [Prymnesium parvum]|uniref:Uncharacterized protein n=1 Tax=Prymnesium parvum TaxID=97485 RepID=A0AB34JU80_PRYPA
MHGCACGRCGRRTAISPCPLGPAPAFRSADGHSEAAANGGSLDGDPSNDSSTLRGLLIATRAFSVQPEDDDLLT